MLCYFLSSCVGKTSFSYQILKEDRINLLYDDSPVVKWPWLSRLEYRMAWALESGTNLCYFDIHNCKLVISRLYWICRWEIGFISLGREGNSEDLQQWITLNSNKKIKWNKKNTLQQGRLYFSIRNKNEIWPTKE